MLLVEEDLLRTTGLSVGSVRRSWISLHCVCGNNNSRADCECIVKPDTRKIPTNIQQYSGNEALLLSELLYVPHLKKTSRPQAIFSFMLFISLWSFAW